MYGQLVAAVFTHINHARIEYQVLALDTHQGALHYWRLVQVEGFISLVVAISDQASLPLFVVIKIFFRKTIATMNYGPYVELPIS